MNLDEAVARLESTRRATGSTSRAGCPTPQWRHSRRTVTAFGAGRDLACSSAVSRRRGMARRIVRRRRSPPGRGRVRRRRHGHGESPVSDPGWRSRPPPAGSRSSRSRSARACRIRRRPCGGSRCTCCARGSSWASRPASSQGPRAFEGPGRRRRPGRRPPAHPPRGGDREDPGPSRRGEFGDEILFA